MARQTAVKTSISPEAWTQFKKDYPQHFTRNGEYRGPESIIEPYRTYKVIEFSAAGQRVIQSGPGSGPRMTASRKLPSRPGSGVRIIRTRAQRKALARQLRSRRPEMSFKAPRSQFRTSQGAAIIKGRGALRPKTTRSEFISSLARKQDVSKSARKFISQIEQLRRKSGAAERRRRIDALTAKQRLIKEIRGQPLSEMGRLQKQALIDYIDRQFSPFIGSSAAVFTSAKAENILQNINSYYRREGIGEVKRPITPTEAAKKSPGEVAPVQKEKGLAGVRQTLQKERGMARTQVITEKNQLKRTFTGILILGGLGIASGIVGVLETIRHPVQTAKAQIEALKHPVETLRFMGEEFKIDPVGVVAEYYTFGKTLHLAGRGVKRSPAGRFVQEEFFIRSQPKEIQGPVRKILRAARIQEKINPLKIRSITKVDFLEVKSLTAIEAQALARVLRKTDSVVFGSWSARTLGGKKLPKPKDVDLATRNVKLFNELFIKELPKEIRKNYVVKGEKILRKSSKNSRAPPLPILDVKPLSRLIPQRSLFTGRGRIPVVGYVTRIKGLERIRKILKINKQLEALQRKLNRAKTKKARNIIGRQINKLLKKRKAELKKFSPSELAELKKVPAVGGLDFPTQQIVKLKGIKMVGFGEQTVRKALGTLQVLIERNVRRAKDPSSLLKALEVQRAALKRSKKLTLFKKRKLNALDDAIRMLKSKAFAKLLEKKVPGLTREYPLVAKINVSKLKKINFQKVRKEALRTVKKARPARSERRERKTALKSRRRRLTAQDIRRKSYIPRKKRLSQKKVSRLATKKKGAQKRRIKRRASKLPKRGRSRSRRASRLPSSRLRKGRTSKLRASQPSKFKASRVRHSKLAQSRPSKLPLSKLQPSRIRQSRPSKLRPSKLRPSKLRPGRPSKLTASQIRSKLLRLPTGAPRPPPALLRKPRTKKEEQRLINWVKQQKQIYRPSLAAILFEITGVPRLNVTGFEIRPIPIFRHRIKRRIKKPKRIKRQASSKRIKKK